MVVVVIDGCIDRCEKGAPPSPTRADAARGTRRRPLSARGGAAPHCEGDVDASAHIVTTHLERIVGEVEVLLEAHLNLVHDSGSHTILCWLPTG